MNHAFNKPQALTRGERRIEPKHAISELETYASAHSVKSI